MAAKKYLALVAGKLKEVFGSVTGTADAIPAGDATGRLDVSWMPVGIGAETINGLASEALSAGNFVNIYNNAGVLGVRKADATTNGKPAHGFVIAAVASGASATVYQISQTNTQLTGLTPGSDYFLATTAGGVTLTPPSTAGNVVQFLGRASSATELVLSNIETVEIS